MPSHQKPNLVVVTVRKLELPWFRPEDNTGRWRPYITNGQTPTLLVGPGRGGKLVDEKGRVMLVHGQWRNIDTAAPMTYVPLDDELYWITAESRPWFKDIPRAPRQMHHEHVLKRVGTKTIET